MILTLVDVRLQKLYNILALNGAVESMLSLTLLLTWKNNFFDIIDKRIAFYNSNENLPPPKPKTTYRYLKKAVQDFHSKYVLIPADKASDNVIIIWRLHYIDVLKQEIMNTKSYVSAHIQK